MPTKHRPFASCLVFDHTGLHVREDLLEEVLAEDFADGAAVGGEHYVVGEVPQVQVVVVREVLWQVAPVVFVAGHHVVQLAH